MRKIICNYNYLNRTFGLGERGALTPPAAGWLDGVASNSNRILWQTTNPQLFGPHCGIRPVLDQSEAMGSSGILRNIFIWLWERVAAHGPGVDFPRPHVAYRSCLAQMGNKSGQY